MSVPSKLFHQLNRRLLLHDHAVLGELASEVLKKDSFSFLIGEGLDDRRWTGLGDFGRTAVTYGQEHPVVIAGREYQVIPLVHPRQAGKLGAHSRDWSALHARWVESRQNG